MEDLLISPLVNDVGDLYENLNCQVIDIEEDVQFQISHSSIFIGGIKRKLQSSIYFQAMFRGGFKESKSEKVILNDIEAPILKVITRTITLVNFFESFFKTV